MIRKGHFYDFPQLPQGPDEIFELLAKGNNLKIERIISNGQNTPPGKWYNSPETEWVILLQGKATLAFDNSTQTNLNPGDYICIPPNTRHRVIYTSQQPPCIWLAIHFKE